MNARQTRYNYERLTMNVSLDDHISSHMGIDNRLSPPQQSTSFWVVTLFAWVLLPVAAWRHYQRFTATGHLFSMVMLLLVAACLWALFLLMRLHISKFVAEDVTASSRSNLRAISSYASRITVVSMAALVIALTF
jgi:hypothetical protein